MLFNKDFYSISPEDITRLLKYEVIEDKTIEYKRDLPGDTRDERKEFLSDVSSFANASGGMIFYGISEENGTPTEIIGVDVNDVDAVILQLQQVILNNIEPRLTQLLIRRVNLDDGKTIIIIRIPYSWSRPHVVNYQKHWRFYIRTSAGKHPMDYDEVKSSMLQSFNIPEKIRQFRKERLDKILQDDFEVPFFSPSFVALHLIPFSALFNSNVSNIDFDVIPENPYKIEPLHISISYSRHNFDGYICYSRLNNVAGFTGYVQVFRNGIFESVDTKMLNRGNEQKKFVPSYLLEEAIINSTRNYLDFQKQMGVLPPIAIFISLLNIKDYYFAVSRNLDPFEDKKFKLQRQSILLPELIIDDFDIDVVSCLRDSFNLLWNSFGWERSFSYDQDGNWVGGN